MVNNTHENNLVTFCKQSLVMLRCHTHKKTRDEHPIIGLITEQSDTLLSTADDMVGMEASEP